MSIMPPPGTSSNDLRPGDQLVSEEQAPTIWVISDGVYGHLNQSLGVADALGCTEPRIIRLSKRQAAIVRLQRGRLPSSLWPEPLPDIIIGAGSRTRATVAWFKRHYPGICSVMLMDPRQDLGAYDVVAIPQHDNPDTSSNIIATCGAPNRVSSDKLTEARDLWQPRLAHLPRPYLTVLIGGTCRHWSWRSQTVISDFTNAIATIAQAHGMSLLISASRRTSLDLTTALKQQLDDTDLPHHFYCPHRDATADNPFFGYLALADAIVVTADSVSMISEACTTDKPVYVWGMHHMADSKLGRFHDVMQSENRIASIYGFGAARLDTTPLSDTANVAAFVRERWQKLAAGRHAVSHRYRKQQVKSDIARHGYLPSEA